nr:hypothetical protein [Nodosilinea sp. LEGE 07298]
MLKGNPLQVRSQPPTKPKPIAAGTRSATTAAKRATAAGAKTTGALSWQITPIVWAEALANRDPAVAKRAFETMMQMQKIDVAAIKAACRG